MDKFQGRLAGLKNRTAHFPFYFRTLHSLQHRLAVVGAIGPSYRETGRRSCPHRRISPRRGGIGLRCPGATDRQTHVHGSPHATNLYREVCRVCTHPVPPQLKKDEGNTDPGALSGMLAAIDQGAVDSVYVMSG